MADKKRPATEKSAKRSAAKTAKTTKTAKAAKKKPPVEQRPPERTGPIVEQLGPRLRAEFEALEKSEAKIVRGLSDGRTAELFLADPAAALRRMKVDVPPITAARLKGAGVLRDLVAPRNYLLPNGQVVTARVTVRFTTEPPRKER